MQPKMTTKTISDNDYRDLLNIHFGFKDARNTFSSPFGIDPKVLGKFLRMGWIRDSVDNGVYLTPEGCAGLWYWLQGKLDIPS
jgi:hypothetical protein